MKSTQATPNRSFLSPRAERIMFMAMTFCLLTPVAMLPAQAQVSGRTVTLHTDGITAFDNWVDFSNPDTVFGLLEVYATGSASNPGYQLFYQVYDSNFLFFNSGQGPIPASAVTFSGGSVTSGKMVVSVDVDTCPLDPNVFMTFGGSCGIISATWTEVPGRSPGGFTARQNGTIERITPTTTQHISGTLEDAVALAKGTVIGSALTPTTNEVFIGLTHQVTVTTQVN